MSDRPRPASFRTHLAPLNIDFDFIDGPASSTPAPGVDLFYDPPYYSFWEQTSSENIQTARKWLLDYMARSGPYDAVMGFSQGCALAASVLLLHAAETPLLPPPFKAAIFICGGAPLSIPESLGYTIHHAAKERDDQSRVALASQADSASILAQGSDRWTGSQSGGLSEDELRAEIQGSLKIGVPTVHIYGDKDPRYPAGVQLSALCEEGRRKTYNHEGGHEIPRKDVISRKLAWLVRWAVEEAELY